MYLDFEDYRPDIQPIGRAISWREGVLVSIIVHLAMIILLLVAPQLFPFTPEARKTAVPVDPHDAPRFVFVQPRLDMPALRPPNRGEASDKDRLSRAPERAKKPTDPLPFSRGNTPERVESVQPPVARGTGPAPEPPQGQPVEKSAENQNSAVTELPESPQKPPAFRAARHVREPSRRRWTVRSGASVRYQGRRVWSVGPAVRCAGQAQLAADDSVFRDDVQRPRGRDLQRSQGWVAD